MDIYENVKNIGNGMFGQVYLAKHKIEQKNYAVKRINFKDINQKDRENIENEVKVLEELKHPNIVSYKDSFFDSENYFNIVMIYCDGGDFYNKIRNAKNKHFTENEIIEWIVQLGLALSYIHDKKILHRDLKTQNIFIKDGKIRIGDFGIAKIFNQTKDLAGSMVGTPLYMSPEQYSSKKYGFKSDIWAFGCCLYEMCNLKHAFEGLTWNAVALKVMKGTHGPTNSIYSKDLRALVDSMLSVNPKNRPTISTILEKPFIKKKVAAYIYDFIQVYKNDKTLEADEIQCTILKEQADKLGVFNSIMKEIKDFDDGNKTKNNLTNSSEKSKNLYLRYLKKKQEEKRKIEEKIVELEKQKKLILRKGKDTKNKVVQNRNASSVEKLKFKDSSNPKLKRSESNKKSIRKLSGESEGETVKINESKDYASSNMEETKKLNKALKDIKSKNTKKSMNTSTGSNRIIVNKNYGSNNKEDSLEDLEIINEELEENIPLSEKTKITQLVQEIDKMREYLEKTQNKIIKIEKKITTNNFAKDMENEAEAENDISVSDEEIDFNSNDVKNFNIVGNMGNNAYYPITEELDEGSIKIKERIKFFKNRCESALGNKLFIKAYDYLKSSKNSDPSIIREHLINLFGKNNIGFWQILGQILFLEEMITN